MSDTLRNKDSKQFMTDPQTPDTSPMIEMEEGNAQTRDRLPKGTYFDELYLSKLDREELGIPDALLTSELEHNPEMEGQRVVVAIENAEAPHFSGKTPALWRHRRKYPSIKVVEVKGKPQAREDVVYATISREEWENAQANHDAVCKQFFRGVMEQGEVEGTEGVLADFKQDHEALMQLRGQVKETLIRGGILQKWPGNMSVEDIEKHMGVENTLEIERQAARAGRSAFPDEEERWQNYLAQRAESGGRTRGRNRTISAPGSPTRPSRG